MQKEPQKSDRLDSSSAARVPYGKEVEERVLKPLKQDGLRQLTGAQTTKDRHVLPFGRITSTGASNVLLSMSQSKATREEA